MGCGLRATFLVSVWLLVINSKFRRLQNHNFIPNQLSVQRHTSTRRVHSGNSSQIILRMVWTKIHSKTLHFWNMDRLNEASLNMPSRLKLLKLKVKSQTQLVIFPNRNQSTTDKSVVEWRKNLNATEIYDTNLLYTQTPPRPRQVGERTDALAVAAAKR